jgi:pimeloyl-ACP methyl ester carboxylesterase
MTVSTRLFPGWPMSIALAFACVAPAFAADDALSMYAQPGTLVDIGNDRRLNLRCSGDGSPTIVLEAGLGMTSRAWATVQPMLATKNKVCSYDRAGFGFSDGGPPPRDLAADAADLAALITSAAVAKPVVLVAHSYGTAIVREYAKRHRSDLAGIVLLDPSPMNLASTMPEDVKQHAEAIVGITAFATKCRAAAEKNQLPATAPPLSSCLAPDDPHLPAPLNDAIRHYKLQAGFWDATIGELQGDFELSRQLLPDDHSLGDAPVIVLSADGTFAAEPSDNRNRLEDARAKTHAAIVKTSTHGERRMVTKASHFIQDDQPQAVVDAVDAVVRKAKMSASPPALKEHRG